MHRTNFYSHIPFRSVFAGNALTTNHSGGLSNDFNKRPFFNGDHFSSIAFTSFEKALHQEIQAINARKQFLDQTMKNKSIDEFGDEERHHLMDGYSKIQQSQKFLSLILENVQKCSATIVANFR